MAKSKKLTSQEERQLILYFQKNPVIAANKLLVRNGKPLVLVPHQRIALKSLWENKPFNLFIFGRGMAKTFILAVYFTLQGTLFPDERLGIVSASYRQSQLVFDEIIRFYDESPYIYSSVKKPPTKAPTECSMTWFNRSFVKALPLGDGNKIRGYRFFRLGVDETAQVDPDIIDLSLIPMLNVNPNPTSPTSIDNNNQIIMLSTAFYQFNHLYDKYLFYTEQIENGDKDYNVQDYTYHDAPPGFINMKNIEYSKRTMPRIKFLMENENVFPADSDGFFPASLLHSVVSRKVLLEAKGREGFEYVMGIDPARESDNMAIVIIRLGNYSKVVRVHIMHRKTFPQMVDQIRKFLREYNIVRIAMDQGGGGGAIRDLLAEPNFYMNKDGSYIEEDPILPIDPKQFPNRKGNRILNMVYFSSKEVNDMNQNLKADLENKQILFPAAPLSGDAQQEKLHEEVLAMIEETKTIVTTPLKNGLMRFDTPNDRMKKDRYSALLLAAKAARDYVQESQDTQHVVQLASGMWVPVSFM